MSEDSSITVDQPLRRNNNQDQRQDVIVPLRAMFPLATYTTARRILMIQNQSNIVIAIATLARNLRQAIYVMSGRGYVSQATMISLPSRQPVDCNGRASILYLSGWFQPMIPSGLIHACLSGIPHGVSLASTLIAYGTVEVDVIFVCGERSIIPPDPPGPPREPPRLRVTWPPQPQAPM